MRCLIGATVAGLLQLALLCPSQGGELVRVKITDLAFVPADVHVQPGDTVEWVNEDFIDHTATEKAEQWDVVVPAGKQGQFVFKQPGTFSYFCKFHPGMTGKVHVVTK